MSDWKEQLRKANVDVDGAIKRFINKEDRYIKYLKLFADSQDLHNLNVALERNEVKEAFDFCHTIKGVSGNLGFMTLYEETSKACDILRVGKMDGVKELIDKLTPNYQIIVSIIRENFL